MKGDGRDGVGQEGDDWGRDCGQVVQMTYKDCNLSS